MALVVVLAVGACSRDRPSTSEKVVDSGTAAGRLVSDTSTGAAGTHALTGSDTLSLVAASKVAYRINGSLATGTITGIIVGTAPPGDTTVTPTHDIVACRPFTAAWYASRSNGIGDAVVYLVGITEGRENEISRRASVTLSDCQLDPHVQLVAAGGTLLVKSKDKMMARLRFVDVGPTTAPRALVPTNDAGQVVPVASATKTAGVVAVRDDMHPWVRGYVAVAPHPFVSVSAPDGTFTLDRVPTGAYTLVMWHERFGTRAQRVVVTANGSARADFTIAN